MLFFVMKMDKEFEKLSLDGEIDKPGKLFQRTLDEELDKPSKLVLGGILTFLTAQLVYWTLSVVPGIGEHRFFDSARETVQFSVLRDHGMNPRNLEIFSDYNGTADYKAIIEYFDNYSIQKEEKKHRNVSKEDFPEYYD